MQEQIKKKNKKKKKKKKKKTKREKEKKRKFGRTKKTHFSLPPGDSSIYRSESLKSLLDSSR